MPSSPEIYVPHVGWLAHPADDEVALYLSRGLYEYREQAFLWRYLRPGDAVIDCGAHFGGYPALVASVRLAFRCLCRELVHMVQDASAAGL